ncbi:MAG: DNA methyltransferase [Sedimentisphaerales bacterium]
MSQESAVSTENVKVLQVKQRKVASISIPKNDEVVSSIRKLHGEIIQNVKFTLQKGIALGGLLVKTKKLVGHGNWMIWVEKYLPCCSRSVANYINLYEHRGEIKLASLANLNDAYRFLANSKNYHRTKTREATRNFRLEFADKKSNFKNPENGDYIGKIIAGDNCTVMKEMIKNGMSNKYSGIISSPPYNANFVYGKDFNDDKPYDEYLTELLKPFPLYPKLLRTGGRVIYIIGNIVKKENRDDNGDYNYQLIDDLKAGVKRVAPNLRFYNQIIWNKTSKNPLNNSYGSFANPKSAMTRCCHENILIWSNEQFELENIEKTEPDISAKEFKEWAWSVWSVAPFSKKNNPHFCSFPSMLIERLLKFYFFRNDLILDPYAGSFITGQVCKKLGRRFTGIELNKNYCEYAVEQLKKIA